jgi:hypothetical protein
MWKIVFEMMMIITNVSDFVVTAVEENFALLFCSRHVLFILFYACCSKNYSARTIRHMFKQV